MKPSSAPTVGVLCTACLVACGAAAQETSAASTTGGDLHIVAAAAPATSLAARAANVAAAATATDAASSDGRITRGELSLGARSGVQAGTGQPAGSARLSDVSYRWWLSRGPADFGVGIGAMTLATRAVDGSAPRVDTAPSLSVGMRLHSTAHSTVFADASSAYALGSERSDAYVGKVGAEWKPASLSSRWSYGGLAWRLSADSKMSLRVRHGGVALYMRSQF